MHWKKGEGGRGGGPDRMNGSPTLICQRRENIAIQKMCSVEQYAVSMIQFWKVGKERLRAIKFGTK